MPSFFDAVTEPDRWALTDFVYSLGDADAPNYATLLVARPLDDDIDPAKGASLFDGRPERALSGDRPDHGAGPRLRAGGERRRGAGGLRRAADRVRGALARHARRHLRHELPDARGAARGRGAHDARGRRAGRRDRHLGRAAGPCRSRAQGERGRRRRLLGRDARGRCRGRSARRRVLGRRGDPAPAAAPEGVAKPYFLFGDASKPVDLWFLDLASKRVHQYAGRGSAGLTALEGGEVEGSGHYEAGVWSASFVRSLRSTNERVVRRGPVRPGGVLGLGRHRARARQPPRHHAVVLRLPAAAREALGRRARCSRPRSACWRWSSWS